MSFMDRFFDFINGNYVQAFESKASRKKRERMIEEYKTKNEAKNSSKKTEIKE